MDSRRDSELPPLLLAGMACTELIADPRSWINRRVETTEILTREETRRRVSVDFTLSDAQLEPLRISDGVVVPISVLTKEARRNFDLRDESGRSVPVLGKRQNGELAHISLLNAAWDVMPHDIPAELFELLAADLRQIVFSPPRIAENALGFFIGSAEQGDEVRSAIWNDPTCRSLLDALWINYVLFAVLPPGGANRRVLKYSYGDDFSFATGSEPFRDRVSRAALRPDRRRFLIECPGAWRAESFHLEIAIPEELRIEVAVLWDFDSNEQLSDFDFGVNRAALYASEELSADRSVTAYVDVAAERTGRTFQAAATSLVVAALLWVGVASGLDADNPGAAVSILLAGAALFSGITAGQGEHLLVKKVFGASRRWLAVISLAALAGSTSLAMEIPDERPVGVWRIAAIVAALACIRLMWSAVRAAE